MDSSITEFNCKVFPSPYGEKVETNIAKAKAMVISQLKEFPSPYGEKVETNPTCLETLRYEVFEVRLRESTDKGCI